MDFLYFCANEKLWWWWLLIEITDYKSTIRAIFICSRHPGREGEREDRDSFGFQVESRFPGISYQVKWDQDWKGNLMGKEGNGKLSGV